MSNQVLTHRQIKILIGFKSRYERYEGGIKKTVFLKRFMDSKGIFITTRHARRIMSKAHHNWEISDRKI